MADVVVSTHTVDRPDREDFWRQLLADPCAAVQFERRTEHGDFAAQLRAIWRGRLQLVEWEATPQVHRRTPREIRRADATYFQTPILTQGAAHCGKRAGQLSSRPATWSCTRTRDRSRLRSLSHGRPWCWQSHGTPSSSPTRNDEP